MATFSELVDSLVSELHRPDRLASIAQAVNATIRELHFATKETGGHPLKYLDNLQELTLQPTQAATVWDLPSPSTFCAIEAIRCTARGINLAEVRPSQLESAVLSPRFRASYYRSGQSLAMSNLIPGSKLLIAYYTYLPALTYYPVSSRGIVSVPGPELRYVTTNPAGESPNANQLAAETNWMIDRHEQVIRAGVLARHYNAINDLDRAARHFSAYDSARISMQRAERCS